MVAFDLSMLMLVRPTCAYIDPGMGSLLLQVILGSVLAGLVAIKLFWRQLKMFVAMLIGRSSNKIQPLDKSGAETEQQEGQSDV